MSQAETQSAGSSTAHAASFLFPLFAFLFIAVLHVWLYTHISESRRDGGWPNIVLRNWHEYGYTALHGQLVANPGGLAPGEAQFIYSGHRPAVLLPPYWLKELPGPAFGDGALYDLTVLAITFAAMLALFGCGWRGIFLGTVLCFTPGFINNVSLTDTINIPALIGLSAMGFAAMVFSRRESSPAQQAVALAVTLLFMCLNWSTLFSLGIAAVYIFCRRRDWKPVAIFFTPGLLAGLYVFMISMHSKSTDTGATAGDFWNSYLFGPLGYDHGGMTWGKAIVRLGAVNALAWFSLAFAGLFAFLMNGRGPNWKLAPWPLLAGIAAVFTLRNYNAHHPWNAVCFVGLGLLFSFELLTATTPAVASRWRKPGTIAVLALVLAYAVAMMALDGYNDRAGGTLREFIVKNTPRHALVLVAADFVPTGPVELKGYTEMFDRKLAPLESWNNRSDGREVFVLTHGDLPAGAALVAKSHVEPKGADTIMAALFEFYRSKIARRTPGLRKTYFDDYQLGKF